MQSLKRLFLLGALLLSTLTASARSEWLNLAIEARAEYQHATLDGESLPDDSGFRGRNFNLKLLGDLGGGFSYGFRHRLNKMHRDARFFDATDWLYLTYTTPNDRWAFSAGKQVVQVGGYEYDLAPIDGYFSSEYCTNFPCYQWGASVTYALENGRDAFTFQVTESPFCTQEELYAYNLYWSGGHEWFEALYSVNAIEWAAGEYIYYIALGNRLKFRGVTFEFDLTNRATKEHPFLLQNYTLMGQATIDLGRSVRLLAKASHDVNSTASAGAMCVVPGTELTRVGGIVEYYPIKEKRSVRLHAAYHYTFGETDERNTLRDGFSVVNVGLTWHINLLSLAK